MEKVKLSCGSKPTVTIFCDSSNRQLGKIDFEVCKKNKNTNKTRHLKDGSCYDLIISSYYFMLSMKPFLLAGTATWSLKMMQPDEMKFGSFSIFFPF